MSDFQTSGFHIIPLNLPAKWLEFVLSEQWVELDKLLNEDINEEGGLLRATAEELLFKIYKSFRAKYETMLSVRLGPQDEDQEGIWHDDSSRHMAFSLSLNTEPRIIKGGELSLRPKPYKGVEEKVIETQPYGNLVAFLTGQRSFEHKVSRVTNGKRVVFVIWATLQEV